MKSWNQEEADDLDWRMEFARLALTLDSPHKVLETAAHREKYNVNLLYAYIQSCVRLAAHGDVDAAAAELSTTRQSVARHVQQLQNMLECKLFVSVGTESRLTEHGALWLPRLKEIHELASELLKRRNELQTDYRSVQLPLRYLTEKHGAPKLIRDFASAWMTGSKEIPCTLMEAFRPYWIVYYRKSGKWHAREIGERSSLACWYGSNRAQKSVGLSVPDMISGMEFKDEVSFVLDAVYTKGGFHYSEVCCKIARPGHEGLMQVHYHRAMAELVDENGEGVVASVIDAPHMKAH